MTKPKPAEPALFVDGVPEEPSAPKTKRKHEVAKVEHLPPPPPANMLAIIASAAANPAVDVSKMRELLTMQREIMAEEARIAFTNAFITMQLPSISRDGKIDEGITRSGRQGKKTRYATFENINAVIEPILKHNGFALWFEPAIGANDRIIMRGHLDHIRGHGKTCEISLPLETQNKNALQGAGSSISYGKRYAAIALLNIVSHAPEDQDTDGNAPASDIVSEEQFGVLVKACEVKDAPQGKLVDYLNSRRKNWPEIGELKQLPAARFDEALAAIKSYRPAK
jgi:ERF superfamily protein